MTKRPITVELATWLQWILVAAGLVVSVLVVLFRNDIDAMWSPAGAGDGTVQSTDFVPVVLVLYGVIAITMATLISLFRGRHPWAQHGLAVISLGILVSALATMRTESPTMVLLSAVAAGVVAAVSVVFLWHPMSNRFVHDTGRA